MYTLRFDGLYREITEPASGHGNNSGLMCYGWLIYQNDTLIAKGHGGYIHRRAASSNGAEYLALIEGLEAIIDMGINHEQIVIMGDAKTVIEQMQGISEVNSYRVKNLYHRAKLLCQDFPDIDWKWVPRKNNHAADWLTRHALDKIHFKYALSGIKKTDRGRRYFGGFLPVLDLMICQRQNQPA